MKISEIINEGFFDKFRADYKKGRESFHTMMAKENKVFNIKWIPMGITAFRNNKAGHISSFFGRISWGMIRDSLLKDYSEQQTRRLIPLVKEVDAFKASWPGLMHPNTDLNRNDRMVDLLSDILRIIDRPDGPEKELELLPKDQYDEQVEEDATSESIAQINKLTRKR